jgi:hypothetical protein
MVDFGRQVDAAAINWTLLCVSRPRFSWSRIRCRQRSTLGKGNASEEAQNRGCDGSTELPIVVSRRSWREISPQLCGKLRIGTKKVKRSKKKERPVGTVGGNKSFTGGTNGSEERMPEGSRVSCCLGICGSSTTAKWVAHFLECRFCQ